MSIASVWACHSTRPLNLCSKIVLTGDERWGQSGAKVLDNLGDWVDLVLAPSNPGFMRAYGASTYLDKRGAWVTAQTDRLLRSYVKHGPDRRFLELQDRPLPIPDKVDSWLVAEVC